MRGRLLGAAVLIGVLAGCGTSPGGAIPTFTPGEPLPESTFVRGPGASYRGAQIEGVLTLGEDGCLRIDAEAGMGGEGLTGIVWPQGTTLRRLPSGQAEVVWSDGTLAARTGDYIRASGAVGASASGPCFDAGAQAFTLEAIYSTGR